MANEKQLKILKQGTKVWNNWRDENPSVKIDLRRADLSMTALNGADLTRADLSEANFVRSLTIRI